MGNNWQFTLAHSDTAPPETARRGVGIVTGEFEPSAAGDLDRDGKTDIAGWCLDYPDSASGSRWEVAAVMESPEPDSYPTRLVWSERFVLNNAKALYCPVCPGDMDRDGQQELLISSGGDPRYGTFIYECRGNDSFVCVWDTAGMAGHCHAWGDFDLDGRVEVATCTYDMVWTIECLGNDAYWVPPWRDRPGYSNGFEVFAGRDVFRNGRPEFFVAFMRYEGMGRWSTHLYCYEATGDNQYERFTIGTFEGFAHRSCCADLDGDGVEEIILAVSSQVLILKPEPGYRIRQVAGWWVTGDATLAAYDMNGNGYNEVIVGATNTDLLEVEAIRVLTPRGGETYYPGDTCWISWETFSPPRCDSISLLYSTDHGSTWLPIASGIAPTDTAYPWPVPNVRYLFCYVKAIAYGPGYQWDDCDSCFRILGDPGVEESPQRIYQTRLSVLPNPARNRMNIEYELAQAGPVELSVLDATGRKVAVLASGVHQPGRYSVRLAVRDSPSARRVQPPVSPSETGWQSLAGVYFVRLQADRQIVVRKAVVE
ncbi:MAG: T9SS type A sorting domain-containing protein [candidate division WOR-3 bacterium]